MHVDCDSCGREADCIQNRDTSAGEGSFCCRCRSGADADGYCDECRPDDLVADELATVTPAQWEYLAQKTSG